MSYKNCFLREDTQTRIESPIVMRACADSGGFVSHRMMKGFFNKYSLCLWGHHWRIINAGKSFLWCCCSEKHWNKPALVAAPLAISAECCLSECATDQARAAKRFELNMWSANWCQQPCEHGLFRRFCSYLLCRYSQTKAIISQGRRWRSLALFVSVHRLPSKGFNLFYGPKETCSQPLAIGSMIGSWAHISLRLMNI